MSQVFLEKTPFPTLRELSPDDEDATPDLADDYSTPPQRLISAFNLPDLSLHPSLHAEGHEVLSNEENFVQESRIDILTVSGANSHLSFKQDQNDKQVIAALDALDRSREVPAIAIICVTLESNEHATFEQRATISKVLTTKIFDEFGIHGGFLPDLVGRPNYWSAYSQIKETASEKGDIYEFFCQHPRWHQKGRYDKMKKGATQGNKAPCSVYMSHDEVTNTTLYFVAAPDDGVWFSFLERLQLCEQRRNDGHISPADLAASPWLVHALVSNIAFEQATIYAADVRKQLFTPLKNVNDFVDSKLKSGRDSLHQSSYTEDQNRLKLQAITIELHQVSQMINTGLGSAGSSLRLSRRLVQDHTDFIQRTGRGQPGTMIHQTHAMMRYVLDSFHYQQNWLESYKVRKETAMNFVFNMVTQQDSSTNLEVSNRMARDSNSMNAITILTMIFLPGTFTATLFSSVAFRASDSGAAETTAYLWPFFAVTVFLTASVLLAWYFRRNMGRWRKSLMNGAKGQKAKAAWSGHGNDVV